MKSFREKESKVPVAEETTGDLPKPQDVKKFRLQNLRKEFVQFAVYASVLICYLMVVYYPLSRELIDTFDISPIGNGQFFLSKFLIYVIPCVLLVVGMIILKKKKMAVVQYILHTIWIVFYFGELDIDFVNLLAYKVLRSGIDRSLMGIVMWGARIIVVIIPFILFVVIPYLVIEKKQYTHK